MKTLRIGAACTLLFALAGALPAQGLPVGPDGIPIINVESDYMVDMDHSHMPQPDEIAALVQMFACHGITLNVVVDDAIPHIDVMQCPSSGTSFFKCFGPETFVALKAVYFDSGPTGWHYCIFGHQFAKDGVVTSASGIGELGGDDFAVTLGAFTGEIGTPYDRASTFAHELGHNLGLKHHSPLNPLPTENHSPNYASLMSYQYQLHGVQTQMQGVGLIDTVHAYKNLDYSNGRLINVYEGQLYEPRGFGIHPIDFDCDGAVDFAFVTAHLDEDILWCNPAGFPVFLHDYSDWANLEDSTWVLPADEPHDWPVITCVTLEESQRVLGADGLSDPGLCPGAQPALAVEPCESSIMMFADPAAALLPTGDGMHPFVSLPQAQLFSPAGSTVYLQGSDYFVGPTVLNKPMVYASPDGAVVFY